MKLVDFSIFHALKDKTRETRIKWIEAELTKDTFLRHIKNSYYSKNHYNILLEGIYYIFSPFTSTSLIRNLIKIYEKCKPFPVLNEMI